MNATAPAPSRRSGWSHAARIATRGLRWLLPTALLACIPKCPACLAAYVALGTGLGLSLPVAETLRVGLIGLSVGALAWLTWTRFGPGLSAHAQSRFKKIPSSTPTPNATPRER